MTNQDVERYTAAAHGMQSGVAMTMNYDPGETEPKHLRVGVNSAMVGQQALATLLIDKGYFTEDEYHAAIADAMESERDKYQAELSERLGTDVRLA